MGLRGGTDAALCKAVCLCRLHCIMHNARTPIPWWAGKFRGALSFDHAHCMYATTPGSCRSHVQGTGEVSDSSQLQFCQQAAILFTVVIVIVFGFTMTIIITIVVAIVICKLLLVL